MDVKGAAVTDTFGETVALEFEDMDANGEHGLALTLVAMALATVRADGPECAVVVDAVISQVEILVSQYQAREVPARYV